MTEDVGACAYPVLLRLNYRVDSRDSYGQLDHPFNNLNQQDELCWSEQHEVTWPVHCSEFSDPQRDTERVHLPHRRSMSAVFDPLHPVSLFVSNNLH